MLFSRYSFCSPSSQGFPVSPGLQSDPPHSLLWTFLVSSVRPELVVLRPADQQVLGGQPQAVVEMDRHRHQAVVDQEGHLGTEDGREPLDHHEEDVLNDDEQRPDVENPQRLTESQEISPIFSTETTENI